VVLVDRYGEAFVRYTSETMEPLEFDGRASCRNNGGVTNC